jgi:fructuronate reductase
MLRLCYDSLSDPGAWKAAGINTPRYDPGAVAKKTIQNPIWVHFGAGNIFRAYVAALQDRLLNGGFTDRGIIVAETHDPEILDLV